MPAGLLAADQRGPRPAEEVQDVFTGQRRTLDRAHCEFHGLLSQMQVAGGIVLLDVPEIERVVWAVVLVAGAFLPAVEADLERAHEVLPGQDRVLFVPDDALAEVEAAGLERAGVVPQVGVPAPDVERSAWLQDARGVAEPVQQHLVEGLAGHEVVLEGAVLGAHLLRRAMGVCRAAMHVKALVVCEASER